MITQVEWYEYINSLIFWFTISFFQIQVSSFIILFMTNTTKYSSIPTLLTNVDCRKEWTITKGKVKSLHFVYFIYSKSENISSNFVFLIILGKINITLFISLKTEILLSSSFSFIFLYDLSLWLINDDLYVYTNIFIEVKA